MLHLHSTSARRIMLHCHAIHCRPTNVPFAVSSNPRTAYFHFHLYFAPRLTTLASSAVIIIRLCLSLGHQQYGSAIILTLHPNTFANRPDSCFSSAFGSRVDWSYGFAPFVWPCASQYFSNDRAGHANTLALTLTWPTWARWPCSPCHVQLRKLHTSVRPLESCPAS